MSSSSHWAVSFDFDNTLLLSEACKHATMREVCSRHEGGLEVLQTVPYDSRTAPPGVVVTRHTIFAGVAKGLLARGTPSPIASAPNDAERFGQHLCAEFSSLLEARLLEAEEVPGAVVLLKHLSAYGIPCYVNTATPQAPIDELVDALGWRRYFRGVFGAPGSKVDNLQTIARAAAAPEPGEAAARLVHVGDGDNDCRAAAEFGCAFIGIALPPNRGGSGAPGGVFSGPCAAVAADLIDAAARLCPMVIRPASK